MTLGEKIKDLRKRFGLTQEKLANLINVSRQAVTKWENDTGIPDTENLKELSHLFGITIDYLLDNKSDLPLLVMRIQLDKTKYKNKLLSYAPILKEYYSEDWEIYNLARYSKMGKLESALNLLTGGDYYLIKDVSDLSPYYLAVKDNIKLLVNIKNWVLEVNELPSEIKIKKFLFNDNIFTNAGRLNLK